MRIRPNMLRTEMTRKVEWFVQAITAQTESGRGGTVK